MWKLNDFAFSLLPLSPKDQRITLLQEVVKGQIWTLDQIQGLLLINVPVRCTVVKLKEGGLLVYNPVAPTREALDMVAELEQRHGKVKHIVLGTLGECTQHTRVLTSDDVWTGLEHKALAGPFCRFFPQSEVWLQPGQWSFPINLPAVLFGFPASARPIPFNAVDAPWFSDLDHHVLGPLYFKSVGGFSETAMFHRATGTLLVTDAVIRVGDAPPRILTEDPRSLLFHARDDMLEEVQNNEQTRRKGYRRYVRTDTHIDTYIYMYVSVR